jgi:hypothetical protein
LAGQARPARTGWCSWRVASCSPLISWRPHDPQKRFVGGFSWWHRGHSAWSIMISLSSFPCPHTSSHFTLAFGSICAPQPSEEVGYVVIKESLYSGALGLPPASSVMWLFAGLSGGRYCNRYRPLMDRYRSLSQVATADRPPGNEPFCRYFCFVMLAAGDAGGILSSFY